MTASLLAERGRGKRGPWELQADTLRAVQVSSSLGPAEKRRLICCPCFPREGGCRRKEVEEGGVVVDAAGGLYGGWGVGENEAEGEKGCPQVFKTDRLILVSSYFAPPVGGKILLISSCSFVSSHILSFCCQKPLSLQTVMTRQVNLTLGMHLLPSFRGALCVSGSEGD